MEGEPLRTDVPAGKRRRVSRRGVVWLVICFSQVSLIIYRGLVGGFTFDDSECVG